MFCTATPLLRLLLNKLKQRNFSAAYQQEQSRHNILCRRPGDKPLWNTVQGKAQFQCCEIIGQSGLPELLLWGCSFQAAGTGTVVIPRKPRPKLDLSELVNRMAWCRPYFPHKPRTNLQTGSSVTGRNVGDTLHKGHVGSQVLLLAPRTPGTHPQHLSSTASVIPFNTTLRSQSAPQGQAANRAIISSIWDPLLSPHIKKANFLQISKNPSGFSPADKLLSLAGRNRERKAPHL